MFRTQSSLENGVKEMNLRYKEFGDVKVRAPPFSHRPPRLIAASSALRSLEGTGVG